MFLREVEEQEEQEQEQEEEHGGGGGGAWETAKGHGCDSVNGGQYDT